MRILRGLRKFDGIYEGVAVGRERREIVVIYCIDLCTKIPWVEVNGVSHSVDAKFGELGLLFGALTLPLINNAVERFEFLVIFEGVFVVVLVEISVGDSDDCGRVVGHQGKHLIEDVDFLVVSLERGGDVGF